MDEKYRIMRIRDGGRIEHKGIPGEFQDDPEVEELKAENVRLRQEAAEIQKALNTSTNELFKVIFERDRLRQEKAELTNALNSAIDRLKDMLMGDDGQAWVETEKALPRLEAIRDNMEN